MAGYGEKVIKLWNDWQLSAVVLLSLTLQLLLLSTADFRRRTRHRRWRKYYFWTLYVGSRYIAPYALGILSRASEKDAKAAAIQAFWAALLLFHLGGIDDFTALTLEDNELWDRRLIEMLIHVGITGYVFVRYMLTQEFRRFIAPFLLIYVAGTIKNVEQVVALKRATMKALIKSVLGIPDAGPDYVEFTDRVDGIFRSGVLPVVKPGIVKPSSKAVDPPNSSADANQVQTPEDAEKIVASASSLFRMFKVLFADGIFSYKERRAGQSEFTDPNASWRAFKIIEIELSFAYDQLYTRAPVSRTKTGLLIRVGSLLLTLTASICVLIPITLHASDYKRKHRFVTYTLLAGAVLTDVVILVTRVFNIRSLRSRWLMKRRRWSGYMAQSNLIKFCRQNLPSESELDAIIGQLAPRIGWPAPWPGYRGTPGITGVGGLRPAAFIELLHSATVRELEASESFQKYFERQSLFKQMLSKSFWKKFKKTTHVRVSEGLQDLIFRQLKKKERQFNDWRDGERRKEKDSIEDRAGTGRRPEIRDPATARGDQVLDDEEIKDLEWSTLGKDFDESLLIWHIATDLCFRQEDCSEQRGNPDDDPEAEQTRKHMKMAKELSNYLLYIMVVHPLMLSSSTTMAIKRCRDTCAEARRHFLKRHIEFETKKRFTTIQGANSVNAKEKAVSEKNAHSSLLDVVKGTPLEASEVKGDKSKSVLWDGCFLAKELNRIMGNPKKKWEVICKVWVEMLSYAAVNCGGYQHAERLKEGGELITFVCLLMTHLGMGKHYKTEVGDAYPHLSAYRRTA